MLGSTRAQIEGGSPVQAFEHNLSLKHDPFILFLFCFSPYVNDDPSQPSIFYFIGYFKGQVVANIRL